MPPLIPIGILIMTTVTIRGNLNMDIKGHFRYHIDRGLNQSEINSVAFSKHVSLTHAKKVTDMYVDVNEMGRLEHQIHKPETRINRSAWILKAFQEERKLEDGNIANSAFSFRDRTHLKYLRDQTEKRRNKLRNSKTSMWIYFLSGTKISKNVFVVVCAVTPTDEFKDETKLTEEVDETKLIEGVAETKLTEEVAETKLTEEVAETKLIEGVAETKLTEEVAETKLTEEVAETKLIEGVAETKLTEEVAETKLTEGVAETKLIEGVAETKLTEEVAETKLTEEVAETKLTEEVAEIKLTEEVAETKLTEEVAETKLTEEVAETKLIEGVAETKLTEEVAETKLTEEVAVLLKDEIKVWDEKTPKECPSVVTLEVSKRQNAKSNEISVFSHPKHRNKEYSYMSYSGSLLCRFNDIFSNYPTSMKICMEMLTCCRHPSIKAPYLHYYLLLVSRIYKNRRNVVPITRQKVPESPCFATNDAAHLDTLLTGVLCTAFGSLMVMIAIFCM